MHLRRRMSWATPAVFAAYAPLALLAANLQEVEPAAADRSILFSIGVGALATLLSWFVLRRKEPAIVLASLSIIAFFSYGHLYDGLKSLGAAGISLARHRQLLPFEGILLLGMSLLLARRPNLASPAARWLTAAGWILLAFPVVTLGVRQVTRWTFPPQVLEMQESELQLHEEVPDIFYIILDGYGRADVLESLYGYDNSPFLDFLRDRGFYIAERAMSNYSHTRYSLASSLNMDYIDPGVLEGGPSTDAGDALLRNNRVFRLVHGLGYSVVAFDTGYSTTMFREADIFLTPDYGSATAQTRVSASLTLNEFEGLLLDTTWGKAALVAYARVIEQQAPGWIAFNYEKHRARVLFTISSLSDFADRDGAYFVMAHVVSPHPPFVFGPQGQRVPHTRPYSLLDIGSTDQDEYVSRYRDQVEYLNRLLQVELEEVLQLSDVPPIIILQGDHGPGGHLGLRDWTETGIQARMAILNAYYLPDGEVQALGPGITPVNSFRVIFDQYFGGEFARLEDASYFLSWVRPYEVIPVHPFSIGDE